jgi:hypothetical protein
MTFGITGYIQLGTIEIDTSSGIGIDSSNNIYITGWTYGNLSGSGNLGRADTYIAKYSSQGDFLWLQQFGSSSDDIPLSGISTDSAGNSYVAGSGPVIRGGDVYLWTYSTNGSQLWSRTFGTTGFDSELTITTDPSSNVIVGGRTRGSFSGFTNAGGDDAFLIKYSSGGSLFWVRQLGTSATDQIWGSSTDSSSNVYVSGYTQGGLVGNNLGGRDGFVAKYSGGGAQQWLRQFGTSGDDTAQENKTDSSGNVYVTGYTSGSLSGSSNGGLDAFLVKYSTTGSLLWTRQVGTSTTDFAIELALDSSGNVYVLGYTLGSFAGFTNAGAEDIFVAKYSTNGTLVWVKQYGTSASEDPRGIIVDSSGNVYLSGITRGSFPGNTNQGNADAFILGLTPNGDPLAKQPVNLSVSTSSGTEAGTSVITITATTLGPVIGNQSVTLGVTGVGITLGDYVLSNSVINIPGGGTTGTRTFTVVNDTLVEGTETATITIGSISSGLLFGNTLSQTITITDDDFPVVNLSVSANSGTEAGTTVITVTATTSDPVIGNQSVDLAVTGVGITAGDYSLSNNRINFLNGQTTGAVTFTVVDDTLVEATETATLTLTNLSSGLRLGSIPSQNITIVNDDFPTVNLSVSANTGTEAGTTIITVTATSSSPVLSTQTVNLGVAGTGITSGDYTLSNSVITIPINTTVGTTTFRIVNDVLVEPTETATIAINSISSGLILGSVTSQNITIVNDDFPTVDLSVSANTGTEAGTTIITVTATSSSPVMGSQTVSLGVTGVTLEDYNLSSNTLTIPDGLSTGTVTFTVVDDAVVEPDETAILTISNPSSGLVLGTTTSQSITITDNDIANPPPVDGNFDGIPDSQQNNIVSIVAANNQYVTFVSEPNQPSVNVQVNPNPDPVTAPSNVDFSLGFFSFDVPQLTPGSGTTITLFLPQGTTANSYWKYGPTSNNTNPHWYDFTYDLTTNTGAILQDINGDGQNEIILHLVDGQRGDDDLIANGQIIDPGAPASLITFNLVTGATNNDDILAGTNTHDLIEAQGGRDGVNGFQGNDRIVGGTGGDVLTGGEGRDTFVYNSTRDAGDRLTDFNVNEDFLDFSALLDSLNYGGSNPVSDGYISWQAWGTGTLISVDQDGNMGRSIPRPLTTLERVSPLALSINNFVL